MSQPLSQFAVFICRNESFRRWIDRCEGLLDRTTDVAGATEFIKRECGITSRRQLDNEPEAAQAFRMLLSKYRREVIAWGLPVDSSRPKNEIPA